MEHAKNLAKKEGGYDSLIKEKMNKIESFRLLFSDDDVTQLCYKVEFVCSFLLHMYYERRQDNKNNTRYLMMSLKYALILRLPKPIMKEIRNKAINCTEYLPLESRVKLHPFWK